MHVSQIEHQIRDPAAREEAFDRASISREHSGARRHRILLPVGDPDHVMGGLEFGGPRARIAEMVESGEVISAAPKKV